jgi:hypothetical protein
MGGYIVGREMMVYQLQRFLSVKLYEELLMSTELETTVEKTAKVKFEGLSIACHQSFYI